MSETRSSGLDRLDRNVVHEICTNQVVVTLHACVKELVENSLDAGATRVEVKLRESGSELLEVVDNGHGITAENYAKLATRHATSKIRGYEDISQTLSTFGFRGEALSAICAMGDTTVCTRTASDTAATLLSYDRFGKLSSQVPAAREVGTTVSVRELFRRLPVRHREFLRNAKAQVSATLRLIQAYAIAQPEIRFHVVAEKVRGHGAGRAALLSTSGAACGWRQAAAAVLGDAAIANVEALEMRSERTGWVVSGIISTPHGGRRARDVQLYFVNRRPIDPPKRIAKLINDTYHQYNSRMWPVVILAFSADQGKVDVNVTPDKRTVFLHNEEDLLAELQQALTTLFMPKLQGAGPALSDFGIRSAASNVPTETIPIEDVASNDMGLATDMGCSVGGHLAALSPQPALALVSEATTPDLGGSLKRNIASVEGALGTPEKRAASVPADSLLGAPPFAVPSSFEIGGAKSSAADTVSLPGFEIVEFSPPAAVEETTGPPAGAAGPGAGLYKSAKTWTQPLQCRNSSGDDGDVQMSRPLFQVIELDPVMGEHASEGSVTAAAAADWMTHGELDAASMRPLGDSLGESVGDGGFTVQEYHAEPQPPWSPSVTDVGEAGLPSIALSIVPIATADMHSEDAPLAPLHDVAPAIGVSVQAAPSMAEIVAGVARRRQRARAVGSGKVAPSAAPSLQFPSAFSLSSLRADEKGRSSLEEVAKFATGHRGPDASADSSAFRFDRNCFSQMRVIGQFNLGFIIAALRLESTGERQGKDESESADPTGAEGLQLFIVDQHASDEKFRFESLNRESRIDRQPLVTPHHLQLTPAQEQLAESHLEVFRLNGFELHRDEARPPGRRLRLATLPTCQGLMFNEKDIHDLLYTLEESEADQHRPALRDASAAGSLLDLSGHRALWSSTALPRPAKVWQLLACRACRGAIMIGKALRVGEMEKVLTNLSTLEQPFNCPHGRPTMRHLVDTRAARKASRPSPPLAQLLAEAQRTATAAVLPGGT